MKVKQSDAIEVIEVLGLIVDEFNSDPSSVACFDLRIVERAKSIIKKLSPARASE